MSDKQIFEESEATEMGKGLAEPDPPINKKKKARAPMSESRKAQLRVQLEKARAVSLQKRQAKAKSKKLETVQEEEVKGLLQTNSVEEAEEVVVKKPRKKNIRYVEETEDEMESRIEKRIREKLEKEKAKEEKERLRTKELDDLRSENAQLKADREKKKEQIKMEVKESVVNPRPTINRFSTFGRRR